MSERLQWGILGAGSIAKAFAKGLTTCRRGRLVAVASRTQEKAEAFGDAWGAPARYGCYQDLLDDKNVQAVYIATPHPQHPEWAIKAAEAGKHVLCEKPMALNRWQAAAMFEAARRSGVLCMEAFMYRCHPQIARLRELLREKVIGEVRMIEASFGFGGGTGPVNPESRLMSPELGGGAILDVGCYPVSMARLVAGEAFGKRFAEPVAVKAVAHLGETGVDEYATAVLRFEGDVLAQVATGVRVSMRNDVTIYGSDGQIHLPTPWVPHGRDGTGSTSIVLRRGGTTETIECSTDVTLYGLEADAVADALPAQQVPQMCWDDTLGNLAVLDAWRAEIGLVYPDEKPRPVSTNIAGRPIQARPGHNMTFARLPGLDKPVSKLIFGALTAHGSYPKAQVMFDQWIESGGNAFDTGHVYGGGLCDRIFGQWLNSRGIRDETVVIAKGMHHPDNTPDRLSAQLDQILENLQTDYADIYIMHRDNIDVPVGEWVDVLDEECRRGRIRIFGGSNWTRERFIAANEYARRHGKQGFTILNNNLALAEMVQPVWQGCIHVSDSDSLQWLEQTQTVHLAWSSTARAFFTDRSGPDKLADKDMARCWYSEENFRRKARAEELARAKGCTALQIAAAWVLHQPFPSLALVGPENPTEMETLLPCLNVSLTPEEVRWLSTGVEAGQFAGCDA